MSAEEDKSIYDIVSIKNIDDEEFVFQVDKVQYLLKAGETRNFPKFMARLAVKHLIDKVLLKQDIEGKSLTNEAKRAELGAKIVVSEQHYQKPQLPTDQEIVEEINKPTDIERALERNKNTLKDEETAEEVQPAVPTTPKKVKAPTTSTAEEFDGLKKDAVAITPERAKLLAYAKNTMKLNIDDPKTKARFEKLSDEDLKSELQMEDE